MRLGPSGPEPYFSGTVALDAFARLPDGSLVLSLAAGGVVPGVAGLVDDSDLVRFEPSSGSFSLWFDGSAFGLTTDGEDVGAVDVLRDGRVVLATVAPRRWRG